VSGDRREPPGNPKDDAERAPLAPVLGAAERFRSEPPAPTEPAAADPAVDEERRAAVGEFLGDLAHTLAARGGAEVEALLERSEHERRQALRDRPELRTLEAATQLLARCRAAWPGDPHAAVEAARLAWRLLSDSSPEPEVAPTDRAPLLAFSREHLAAAERIARRAAEIDRRRGVYAPPAGSEVSSEALEDDAYPLGALPVSEVAEDALAVEVEAALDDLRDSSLDRGRAYDAALAVLDRGRLALARGGPAALADLARAEVDRFLDPSLPPVPREALRHLATAADRGSADFALMDRLTRLLLAACVGFAS
jgi:hypothetical protein